MDTKRKLTRPFPAIFFCFVFVLLTSGLFAQEDSRDVHKTMEYEQKKEERQDYALTHLKNKWELSAGYGRWYFSAAAKSGNPDEPFYLSNMGIGIFSAAWHFHEKLAADLSVGYQQKKDVPPGPGLLTVISGQNIDIEGSGGGFVPVELGLKYYFIAGRLRPFARLSGGLVKGESQFTQVEGNIYDGITRTDFNFKTKAPLAGIAAGIDYRLDSSFMLGLDMKYHHSGKFDNVIGGYERYSGFSVSIKGIVVL